MIKVVVTDLDGTLTRGDELSAEALAALDGVRRDGMLVVLATGRIRSELEAAFPQISRHVDAMVLENGAVGVVGNTTIELASPVDEDVAREMAARGIPFRRGQGLLATTTEHSDAITSVIAEVGSDCQVVHNLSELMVVPAGTTKGTGVVALLRRLDLSRHNAVAIGNAENDIALLSVAEIGAAVADAVPSLKRHADAVLGHPNGSGVAELLAKPYVTGVQRWCPSRHWIRIGDYDGPEQVPATVPGSQARILVTGPSGSGKSYVVGLMAEQWILAGYSVLMVDAEGDHTGLSRLARVRAVDAAHHLPAPTEVAAMLEHNTSVVVDLSALNESARASYMSRLRLCAEARREERGYPHWIVLDEAHLLRHEASAGWAHRGGYVLSTFVPAELPDDELEQCDVTVVLPDIDVGGHISEQPRRFATLELEGGPARPFTMGERITAHVRHRHKYADKTLPESRRFYFHSEAPDVETAGTVREFSRQLAWLPPDIVEFHAERGDFSRWFRDALADSDAADEIADAEEHLAAQRAATIERVRRRIIESVDRRYALDAGRARAFADEGKVHGAVGSR